MKSANDIAVIDKDKDCAIRLFSYLKELVRLRSKVIRDVSSYEEVLWLHKIPKEYGWYSAHWESKIERADDVWVELKKPKIPECPMPPSICEGWYFREELVNSNEIPAIQKIRHITVERENGKTETETQKIEDHSSIENAWNEYLEKKWFPWMEDYEKIRPLQEIYGKLFRIYQLSNKLGESYETILGLGFLTWKTPQNQIVRRHIISAQTRIDFDANTGSLMVRHGSDGAKMIFENDMLEPSELPPHEELQVIESTLQENSENPWDSSIVHSIIRSWIHSLNSESVFSPNDIPLEIVTENPKCNFAPAIILRKRTQGGWLTAFDKIVTRLKLDKKISDNTRALVNLSDDFYKSTDKQTDSIQGDTSFSIFKGKDSYVYFPLPTNNEQLQIIKKLSLSNGVRVQGPPGTGKSHTIANIICHYLATGKKVLVTAYAPRALKVLQGHIPQELSALCVSVLGYGTESMANLQRSVNEITERFNDWDEGNNNRIISDTKKELYKYKEESALISRRLRELRERDTYKFNDISGYEGTAQEIAQLIRSNRKNYGSIPDRVELGLTPPLTNFEFQKLLNLLRNIDEEDAFALSQPMVSCDELPDPDSFRILIKDEEDVKNELGAYKHYSEDHKFKILMEVGVNKRQSTLKAVTELRKAIDEGLRRTFHWLKQAVFDMLANQDQHLRLLYDVTRKRMEGLSEKAQIVDDYHAKLPAVDKAKMLADAYDLFEYLKSGKKIRFWPLQAVMIKRTKYLWHETYIDGRLCDNIITLEKLLDLLDVDKKIKQLWVDWNTKTAKTEGSYASQEAFLSEQLEALKCVLDINSPLHGCKKAIKELSVMSEPKWHEMHELIELEKRLKASLSFELEKGIKERFDKIEDIIDHYISIKNSSDLPLFSWTHS